MPPDSRVLPRRRLPPDVCDELVQEVLLRVWRRADQYDPGKASVETWLFAVPLAMFGGLLGLKLAGETLNIYSQIALVILIGLATKNGILIVEFANQLRDEGRSLRDAVLEAAELRLRPILMTALSTALGAVPLVLAGGAGAEARAAIGIVVLTGVLFSTGLMLFIVPAAYALVGRVAGSPLARTRALDAELGDSAAPAA